MTTAEAHLSTIATPAATRAMPALFTGAVLLNAAMATTSAVSTIVTADRIGPAWAAVPNTAAIVGTGAGALLLTRVMTRRGRRAGLLLGYLAATAGAAVATLAVFAGNVAGLVAGMALLGLGNAAAQLSRYAAADLYPAGRRGAAISTLVWAGTVGAVGGPLLLDPAGRVATGLGWTAPVGTFLFALIATALAVVAARGAPAGAAARVRSDVRLRVLLATPAARPALATMVAAQAVMVAVMTATPLDMHLHGDGLGAVGAILSAHTLGMFLFSPVTGRLIDRFGSRPVMLAGLGTLTAAVAFTVADTGSGQLSRAVAMFLLGYGWNLCFIGGSGRLALGLPASERARVEGAVDAAIWGVAAVASFASTGLLGLGGYGALAALALPLVLVPAILLRR